MDNRTYVGLEVHKETTAVAFLRHGVSDPDERVIPTTLEAYRKLVKGLCNQDVIFCYEAGPCGFDPYRMLTDVGARCEVISPTLVPRQYRTNVINLGRTGQRVKTDRLDARKLARLHRAGELTAVRVPPPEQEGLRDLIRLREDVKSDRRRAIQRLKSMLLRYGKRYPAPSIGWSLPYERWASGLELEQPLAQETLKHLIASVQTMQVQLGSLDVRIEQLAEQEPICHAVAKLRALKGIDTLSAATIAAEVGDFAQFPRASSFMAFVGLVPSEHSSGGNEYRGSITKTGNNHVRRVLVEAAWAYRHRPAVGEKLRRRQIGLDPELVAYSFKAQQRMNAKYKKLSITRAHNVAVTAVARELAGFVWES